MTIAIWNGAVIADSDDTIVVEGNHYFPPDSINWEYLTASAHTSVCPWKGRARYYTLTVDGRTNRDAAWTYPTPSPAASKIAGRVAFWHGVQVKRSTSDREGQATQRSGWLRVRLRAGSGH